MSCLFLLFCSAFARNQPAPVAPLTLSAVERSTSETNSTNRDRSPQSGEWIDKWQGNLTESMDYTVKQLDSFFAMEGSEEYKNARAEGRIRLGWEPRSRDLAEMDLRFRIRVKLPSLQNRVDLLLSDDEDFDDQDTIKAARTPIQSRRDNTTLALRFKRSEDSRLSHRIGTGRRGQVYVKSRFEDMEPLGSSLALFYDAEAYLYTRDHFGSEFGASIQYISPNDDVFRVNNRFYYRDASEDWLWRHEIQYLKPISDHSAAIYTVFTEGASRPNYQLGEVYTSMRWRTNPLREWLYFEVEPFVLWLREEDFEPSYGVALRMEIYYGKDS
ncbi:hypothetical protein CA267_006850 [Alteromonas pelagimontana]|uniref:DUF3570 domain-containing protein n=1 Tax=Alteromonas pelagimontana TaxID=1858656 RepID=A0A6M4MBI4_9ALTE|nr:hypothetical protein [Alteromonas pelagimontana]QJR80513.1 hypothetical protein CA267_006850 [Alteromonas pelagimontana]